MTCDEVQHAISWLLDDELDAELCLEVEAHIDGCATCRMVLEQEGRLRLVIRRAVQNNVAPPSLRRRVAKAIDEQQRRDSWANKALPAAMVAVVLCAFIYRGVTGGFNAELNAVTQRHATNLPMDVTAPDPLAVQSYLSANLPFSVRVPKPDDAKVRVLGGRVIRLNDRDAAHVRYDTGRGQVSVFVYQDVGGTDESELIPNFHIDGRRVLIRRVHGFSTARWRSADLVYSVVSELPENELYETVHFIR